MTQTHRSKILAKIACIISIVGLNVLASSYANAEYLGMPSGRSADVSSEPQLSVEAGFMTGDIANNTYQSFGGRANFKMSPEVVVYGDLVKADVEDADGTGFGIGFLYQIKGITKTNFFALKASFHNIKLEEGNEETDKGNILSVEGLFSGDRIGESDLHWYGNFGIHKFDFDRYDETEIGFGGGIYVNTGFGQFYAGADLIDELTFGLGVRYHLQ